MILIFFSLSLFFFYFAFSCEYICDGINTMIFFYLIFIISFPIRLFTRSHLEIQFSQTAHIAGAEGGSPRHTARNRGLESHARAERRAGVRADGGAWPTEPMARRAHSGKVSQRGAAADARAHVCGRALSGFECAAMSARPAPHPHLAPAPARPPPLPPSPARPLRPHG